MSDRSTDDREKNRLSRRAARYARVGANAAPIAAKMASARLFGGGDRARNAADLALALGGLKGPVMKVAQLLSTIPDALPAEYAEELGKLQNAAPPMGWAFVKRRMKAELGADWQSKFASFERESAASASLGQVHKAQSHDGRTLACKLQYPDMASAVEADLQQFKILLSMYKRMDPAIDPTHVGEEIGARIREELDYEREARNMRLYRDFFAGSDMVRVPDSLPDLSTKRLLTMDWLEGAPLLSFKEESLEVRNRLARAMFAAWWQPFYNIGIIHGDPHLGNYTVFSEGGEPCGINLLDFGCIRIFDASFVGAVIDLYCGLRDDDPERMVHGYETWGFKGLSKEVIEVLNVWARFIYGPLLDNRTRLIADGVKPGEYGRREAYQVHQALKRLGPVTVPREFVFMDRAAIGLGGVLIHLAAELNFYQMFNETIEGFSTDLLHEKQRAALTSAGLAGNS